MITLRSYIIGYVLALACTLSAFGLFWLHEFNDHAFPTHEQIYIGITVLAMLQFLVQLVCFLHFGKNTKGWNRFVFAFAVLTVALVVGGTLWIMAHLQHNTHIPFDGTPSPQHEH